MGAATWAVGSFLGGELSQFAQGRFDKPDYRISLKACLNSFPVEIGTWTRRPGTQYAGHTRSGAQARVIKFDYEQSEPNTLEFTDGVMRARSGATLITTNDAQVVVAVSSANPAVVQTTSAVTWATGDTLIFPGASTPLLENRQFTATKVDTTHFSLVDALSGATLDGSTLGVLVAGATVEKVFELPTLYSGASRRSLRAVQAETTDILLTGSVAPQMLQVTTLPSSDINPVFSLSAVNFLDGPYLDPVGGGTLVTPNAETGIVQLTLSFNAWSSTQAYKTGDFVTSVGVNYQSLIDQNVNLTPASNPSAWAVVSAGAAIGPNGFQGSDVGRLVRLFSEPPNWDIGTTYSAGQDIKFNSTYWKALVSSNTGNQPGIDLSKWAIDPVGAIWTWGKITSLLNLIDRTAGTIIGNTNNNSAAFDGITSQSANNCANVTIGPGSILTFSGYAGKNFTGIAKQVATATIYPSSDNGYCIGFLLDPGAGNTFEYGPLLMQVFLRGKQTLPANAADGTTLAFSPTFSNTNAPITLTSGDQVTAWNYLWFEVRQLTDNPDPVRYGAAATMSIAEVQFFSPPSAGGNGVNVEILGPPLLYTSPISTWRLGVYSNTTGYPTCGCYHEGRIWLGGAVANRWDASVSNGISGTSLNFAPTAQSGAVADSNAISYVFNSDGVNPIYWMVPDLQGVIMGTLAGEWLVQAPTTGPITPTNVAARRVTKIGSANIEPRRTEHTLVLVKRYFQKLMEYFADVFSGKFSAPNLADKAQHITSAQVQEIAYTDAATPILWGRNADGSWFGVTYKRDALTTSQGPTYAAWHRHELGSGRMVEGLAAGPSVNGDLDALTMVTTDSTNSTGVRHVEVMTDVPDELATLASSWFLDDAVNPTSTSSTATALTINGLWHLNGKTVQVFAGGLDCGDPGEGNAYSDFLVTNGSVTVPYGDDISVGAGRGLFTAAFAAGLSLSQIVVGYTYDSEGQTVRPITPADSGARNGPAFAKLTRGHRFGMKLVNTLGLSVGGDLNKPMFACRFTKGDGVTNIDALTTFTGIHQDALRDDYGYEGGCLAWRVSRPFPANVVAVGNNLMTQDQ